MQTISRLISPPPSVRGHSNLAVYPLERPFAVTSLVARVLASGILAGSALALSSHGGLSFVYAPTKTPCRPGCSCRVCNHVMMRCCCFLLLRDMTRAARGHLVLAARMLRSPDVIADMLARMCKYVANLNKIHSR